MLTLLFCEHIFPPKGIGGMDTKDSSHINTSSTLEFERKTFLLRSAVNYVWSNKLKTKGVGKSKVDEKSLSKEMESGVAQKTFQR